MVLAAVKPYDKGAYCGMTLGRSWVEVRRHTVEYQNKSSWDNIKWHVNQFSFLHVHVVLLAESYVIFTPGKVLIVSMSYDVHTPSQVCTGSNHVTCTHLVRFSLGQIMWSAVSNECMIMQLANKLVFLSAAFRPEEKNREFDRQRLHTQK